MSKRCKVRFIEDEEMSDKDALKFSKKKKLETGEGSSDAADYADTNTRDDKITGQQEYESKHTLESDEEEEEKWEKLDIENIEGQEEATEDYEGETKITPFNMKDEMEEGDFDSSGNFVFKKKKEDIKDAWLDNIDWAKAKKDAGNLWEQQTEEEEEDDDEEKEEDPVKKVGIYSKILEILRPGETVTNALKRMDGARNLTEERKQRWKDKKEGSKNQEPQDEDKAHNQEGVQELTGLVDDLVGEGEFDVYGYTYEKIKFEKEKRENLISLATQKPTTTPDGSEERKNEDNEGDTAADDDLDMFASETDEGPLKKADKKAKEETAKPAKAEATVSGDDVRWEFKWENQPDSSLYGPCTSEQMQGWVDQGYFKQKEAWVRRVGHTTAPFYSTRRIDFELYM